MFVASKPEVLRSPADISSCFCCHQTGCSSRRPGNTFQLFLWNQNQVFIKRRPADISSRGDSTGYFKPNRDGFLNPYQVVFVPKPNQSSITALREERTAKSIRNEREVGTGLTLTLKRVQFELLCGFAQRQLAEMDSGDWLDRSQDLGIAGQWFSNQESNTSGI